MRDPKKAVQSRPMQPQPPMQQTHRRRTPLTTDELEAAREQERLRKKWDPAYITAAEAREIPQEVIENDPGLQQRILYSQPDWPENRMSASEALGPLPGGEGQVTVQRGGTAADFFWSPGEDD